MVAFPGWNFASLIGSNVSGVMTESYWKPVAQGVPQFSIISPLL